MTTFKNGYLASVIALLLSWNSIIVVRFLTAEGSNLPDWCSGLENEMLTIPTALCVLSIVFTVLLNIRTKRSLKRISDQHLKNLPKKNALTFLDTQIAFGSIIIQFFSSHLFSGLLSFNFPWSKHHAEGYFTFFYGKYFPLCCLSYLHHLEDEEIFPKAVGWQCSNIWTK